MYKIITISALLIISILAVGVYQEQQKQFNSLGATITTINASDKIKDSRSVINTNFTNLNTDKLEASLYYATTTHSVITSIPNLASIGTIATGTWNGTKLSVSYGGTGSTTLTNGVIYASSTPNAFYAVANGSTGQLLTLGGNGVPYWGTPTVDQAANYDWTGTHNFNIGATSTQLILTATSTDYMSVQSKGYIDLTSAGYAFGQFASTTAGVGTTTITHNLGYVPRMIKLSYSLGTGGAAAGTSFGWGNATSTTAEGSTYVVVSDGAGAATGAQDNTNILSLAGQTNRDVVANLTALTTTTFSLYFSTFGSNAQVYVQWEAYK